MYALEQARAKLNLSLDILRRREDGYHDLRMLLQTVSLCDDVELTVEPGEGVTIETNLRFLPADGRNIAVKAAQLFYRETGLGGFRTAIRLKKRIPVCAGMAGGSSDAAAVLRALNRLHGTGLDRRQLEQLGEQLGSDVPYCIAGGTAEATGRGECLRAVAPLPPCWVVICKPDFSISTPELFSRVDCRKIRVRPQTDALIGRLEAGDLSGAARRMYNVFEDILPERFREIFQIKGKLVDFGALGASMTGTGSAVFGLFDREAQARAAYAGLKGEYSCFLTESADRLPD